MEMAETLRSMEGNMDEKRELSLAEEATMGPPEFEREDPSRADIEHEIAYLRYVLEQLGDKP